jgi:proteasome lid subunit RPN8/RPN11
MSGLPIVQPGVLDAIQAHVSSAWARKVGGILLGRPLDDVVRVEGALPARQVEPYAGEIAFPPSVWEEAYAALDQYPGAKIIGWYHSHPGTGVTLSDYDRRLHRTLFGEATNLALVVDPIGDKLAWFGWTLRDLSTLGRADAGGSTTPKVAHGARGRGRRVVMTGLVAVGITAGAVGGYSLSDWRADHRPVSAESLTRLVQAQRAQIGRVRQALDQARQTMRQDQARLRQLQGNLDAARKALREARKRLREAEEAAPTTFVLHYRVQPGDSLWDLARTFYGDPLAWPKILDANRDRVPDPDHLAVGQVLDIALSR